MEQYRNDEEDALRNAIDNISYAGESDLIQFDPEFNSTEQLSIFRLLMRREYVCDVVENKIELRLDGQIYCGIYNPENGVLIVGRSV